MESSTASPAWQHRATLGLIGQGLVLSSSVMSGRIDAGVLGFSACNLVANGIALTHGASRKTDDAQLAFLTEHITDIVELYGGNVTETQPPPPSDSHNSPMGFLREHASQISIGLRYLGALNMLGSGLANDNPAKIQGAALALTGKTMALGSYTQSAYDNHVPTATESLRTHGFKAGAVTEALAYGRMAYDGFSRYAQSGDHANQLLFGMGQSCFVAAYLSRLGAEFETLELDVDALKQTIVTQLGTLEEPQRSAAEDDIIYMLDTITENAGQKIDTTALRRDVNEALNTPPDTHISEAHRQQHLLQQSAALETNILPL